MCIALTSNGQPHINTASGKITGTGWTTPPDTCNIARRDPEAIAYCPRRNTFFIAGEADQRIVEYSFDGTPTGNELHVPAEFSTINIEGNRGFESLTYNSLGQQFWTTTESPPLPFPTSSGTVLPTSPLR